MEIKIKKNKGQCSVSEIKRLEELFGGDLPDDYKNFLMHYNGGEPESNIFSIPKIENDSGVNRFFSPKEIIKEMKVLGNRLAKGVIPVADAEGGNIVCLSLDRERKGIYFWDHELEDEEKNRPSWRNMFYLAALFEDFINSLRKFNIDEIKFKPGQVIDVWVDPDFLKQIQQEQKE